jgi:hypothetical protein
MFKVRIITLAAVLTIGGGVLAAAPIASADRSGPTPTVTATDDQNRGQAEPGDDKGGQAEPGDDKGGQAEPGDDKNRNVAASAATGTTKLKTAAKTKRHTHLRHDSHHRAIR